MQYNHAMCCVIAHDNQQKGYQTPPVCTYRKKEIDDSTVRPISCAPANGYMHVLVTQEAHYGPDTILVSGRIRAVVDSLT
jgi:hypothetical protein